MPESNSFSRTIGNGHNRCMIQTVSENCRKIKPKKSKLGYTKIQIGVRCANDHSRPPVSCIFSASVKSAVGNGVSEEKSEFATWRDEKYFKYLNINQNVQRGEMRNEKCTFDPGSDMIHWRQNVTFFGTAYILKSILQPTWIYIEITKKPKPKNSWFFCCKNLGNKAVVVIFQCFMLVVNKHWQENSILLQFLEARLISISSRSRRYGWE